MAIVQICCFADKIFSMVSAAQRVDTDSASRLKSSLMPEIGRKETSCVGRCHKLLVPCRRSSIANVVISSCSFMSQKQSDLNTNGTYAGIATFVTPLR